MTPPLAKRLCRHAATVADPAVRATLFRSLLASASDDELRETLDALTVRSAEGDVPSRVALLSFQHALAAMPDRQRCVLDDVIAGEDTPDEEHRVPDYGRGRPLTLGERKSLARKPDRRMFDRVLRDPHPDVIALLLQNPRLTEPDVVRLCTRRPGVPEVLARFFASPRWSLRPAVRRALAMNPTAPTSVVAAVLPLLTPEELKTLITDDRTPSAFVRRCEELLALCDVR